MPTSDLELFEFFAEIFSEATNTRSSSKNLNENSTTDEGYFSTPSETLIVDCVTLEETLNGEQTMITALAKSSEENHDHSLQKLILRIQDFLTDPDIDLNEGDEQTKRLRDYVYPVV